MLHLFFSNKKGKNARNGFIKRILSTLPGLVLVLNLEIDQMMFIFLPCLNDAFDFFTVIKEFQQDDPRAFLFKTL